MYADAVLSAILQAEAIGGTVSKAIPLPAMKMDRSHFKVYSNIFNKSCSFFECDLNFYIPFFPSQECLIELLQEMCGDDAVPKIFKGDKLAITLNNQKVNIDLLNLVKVHV